MYLHAPLLVLVDGLLVGVEAGDLVLEQVHPLVGLLCVRSGDSAPVGKKNSNHYKLGQVVSSQLKYKARLTDLYVRWNRTGS